MRGRAAELGRGGEDLPGRVLASPEQPRTRGQTADEATVLDGHGHLVEELGRRNLFLIPMHSLTGTQEQVPALFPDVAGEGHPALAQDLVMGQAKGVAGDPVLIEGGHEDLPQLLIGQRVAELAQQVETVVERPM